DRISPSVFIIVETDLWPNFLKQLKKREIPSLIVNGRISPRSYQRYKTFKWFFTRVFENISFYSMQSYIDSERLIKCGAVASRVMITGNLKFDQEIPSVTDAEKNKLLDSIGLTREQKIFIGGSTHKGEEEIILDVYEELKGEYKDIVLILAPRNPERFHEVENIISKRNLNWIRRTMCDASLSPGSIDVILLDTIGELSKIYSIGLLVFVGGSFAEIGGHNLLEPAAHTKAVLFGPYMYNFTEISGLLKESGGGIQVKDKSEFLFHARRLLDDHSLLRELGEKAYSIIEEHRGATLRNTEIINGFIAD
ncbi:MAG: glycosyltransferase N-terminal domain-containing protein, partial [Thermodesulfobacteriota bacterium]|nr:glycosyltransferase N-terminal domain-containing protein [Thermodesulfobacteriota bacterium]